MKKTIAIAFALTTSFHAHATLIHNYDAAEAPGQYRFADQMGKTDMYARDTFGEASKNASLQPATTSRTNFTQAFVINAADTGFYRTALPLSNYTVEIWTRLPDGAQPSEDAVLFETGGGDKGFGIFTTAQGTLEFASFSGDGANNSVISLDTSTLDTSDYLQVVAVFDVTNNRITFQVKDVNGVTVSDSVATESLETGENNAAGLFFPAEAASAMSKGAANAGGIYASTIRNMAVLEPYRGEISLVHIHDVDTIASGEAEKSYTSRIATP